MFLQRKALYAMSEGLTREARVRAGMRLAPVTRIRFPTMFIGPAAAPPHIAESLRLSGRVLFDSGGSASVVRGVASQQNRNGRSGKPEAYRHVRRPSRGLLTPHPLFSRWAHLEKVTSPAVSGRQGRKLVRIEGALEQGDHGHCFINVASANNFF